MRRRAGIGSARRCAATMDLRQIKYFVTLYDERSVTKAAVRLSVVQPALSMQISKLEDTYGAKLFERTSRGVVATDAGRTFYNLCQRILSDVDEAQRYFRDASGQVSGELTVGLMPSVANSVLPNVLAQYQANYPDVTLRIVEAYSGSLLDQFNSGKLDHAVVNKTTDLSRMAITPLFRDYLVLVTRYKRGKKLIREIASHRLPNFRSRRLSLIHPNAAERRENDAQRQKILRATGPEAAPCRSQSPPRCCRLWSLPLCPRADRHAGPRSGR